VIARRSPPFYRARLFNLFKVATTASITNSSNKIIKLIGDFSIPLSLEMIIFHERRKIISSSSYLTAVAAVAVHLHHQHFFSLSLLLA
jgi:hypothetical protein